MPLACGLKENERNAIAPCGPTLSKTAKVRGLDPFKPKTTGLQTT